MVSLRGVGRALREAHARLRANRGLYAALHALVICWFLLGAAATGTLGNVDYPCPDVTPTDAQADVETAPTVDGVAFVSVYPARVQGGACATRELAYGERAIVEHATIGLERDRVVLATDGERTVVPTVDHASGRPINASLDPQRARHRVQTPRVGYPFWVTEYVYTVQPPRQATGANGPVVVVEGALDVDPRLNAPGLLLLLVFLGNAVYRLSQAVDRRTPDLDDEFRTV